MAKGEGMTCLRCHADLAGLQHPHTCPGSPVFDWDLMGHGSGAGE